MGDQVAEAIFHIQQAIVRHEFKANEKELMQELKSAVEQNGLNEDDVFSNYIVPRLKQAEDQWDKVLEEIDGSLARMRKPSTKTSPKPPRIK